MSIVADIIGMFAAAPVAAVGAGAKGFGDAVQIGAGNIETLRVAGAAFSAAGEYALGGAKNIQDGVSDMGAFLSSFNPGHLAALGAGIMGAERTTSMVAGNLDLSKALTAPAITAPLLGEHDFDPEHIGQLPKQFAAVPRPVSPVSAGMVQGA